VPTKTKLKCVKLSNNGLNNYTKMNSKLGLSLDLLTENERVQQIYKLIKKYKCVWSAHATIINHQSLIGDS